MVYTEMLGKLNKSAKFEQEFKQGAKGPQAFTFKRKLRG